LAGEVPKVQTYIFVNVVGKFDSRGCSEEEANAKTQVCKASDTSRKAVGCVKEFYSE
jgi:hypothetical protein